MFLLNKRDHAIPLRPNRLLTIPPGALYNYLASDNVVCARVVLGGRGFAVGGVLGTNRPARLGSLVSCRSNDVTGLSLIRTSGVGFILVTFSRNANLAPRHTPNGTVLATLRNGTVVNCRNRSCRLATNRDFHFSGGNLRDIATRNGFGVDLLLIVRWTVFSSRLARGAHPRRSKQILYRSISSTMVRRKARTTPHHFIPIIIRQGLRRQYVTNVPRTTRVRSRNDIFVT